METKRLPAEEGTAGQEGRRRQENREVIMRDFGEKHTAPGSLPVDLEIETTSFCNARCIMCSHSYLENEGAEHLQVSLLQGALKDLLPPCERVELNGNGEPFLHPDIEALIRVYGESGARIGTNTNLSVLPEEVLPLIRAYFDYVTISCDGATEDTYEHVRRGLSFPVFLSNLKRLRSACPDTPLFINAVIMQNNVSEMAELVNLAADLKLNRVTFTHVRPNLILRNAGESMVQDPALFNRERERALQAAEERHIRIEVPDRIAVRKEDKAPERRTPAEAKRAYALVQEYLQAHPEEERPKILPSDVPCTGICDFLLTRTSIDVTGQICVCCRHPELHEEVMDGAHSCRDRWSGELFQKIRGIFYGGTLPTFCLGCALIESGQLRCLEVKDRAKFHDVPDDRKKTAEKIRALLAKEGPGMARR